MSDFSIFISRNQEEIQELQDFCDIQNIKLVSRSLIEFVDTSFFISNNNWEVIFFPSPRAVHFFFKHLRNYNFSGKKIACSGKGTAIVLKNWVDEVHFIPDNPGKINNVQSEFKKWLGNKKVLFAGSNQSKKSVLAKLPENQYQFVQVYETRFNPSIIPSCNLYIFSSPSNVKSFFRINQILSNSHIISWGQTTTTELKKNGIIPVFELKASELSELIQYIKEKYIK